jgi:hypothetical protein
LAEANERLRTFDPSVWGPPLGPRRHIGARQFASLSPNGIQDQLCGDSEREAEEASSQDHGQRFCRRKIVSHSRLHRHSAQKTYPALICKDVRQRAL